MRTHNEYGYKLFFYLKGEKKEKKLYLEIVEERKFYSKNNFFVIRGNAFKKYY